MHRVWLGIDGNSPDIALAEFADIQIVMNSQITYKHTCILR